DIEGVDREIAERVDQGRLLVFESRIPVGGVVQNDQDVRARRGIGGRRLYEQIDVVRRGTKTEGERYRRQTTREPFVLHVDSPIAGSLRGIPALFGLPSAIHARLDVRAPRCRCSGPLPWRRDPKPSGSNCSWRWRTLPPAICCW